MMFSRRTKLVLFSMFVLLLGAMLFTVSQEVQRKQRALYRIEASIAQEGKSLRVLKTEWAYLNSPERLDGLVSKYLGMGRVAQIQENMSDIPENAKVSPPRSKPVGSHQYFKKVSTQGDFSSLLRGVSSQTK